MTAGEGPSRRLLKLFENDAAMAAVHAVDGADRHVLELLCFGHQFASRFILLRSNATVDRLRENDPKLLDAIRDGGSSLGRVLTSADLERDPIDLSLRLRSLPPSKG